MTSYYLSEEACKKREQKLVERIAQDAVPFEVGHFTFLPESDYWLMSHSIQQRIVEWHRTQSR